MSECLLLLAQANAPPQPELSPGCGCVLVIGILVFVLLITPKEVWKDVGKDVERVGGFFDPLIDGLLAPFVAIFEDLTRPETAEERLQRLQRERVHRDDALRRSARYELERFWRQNADALKYAYPRSLLNAYVESRMGPGATPEAAWRATHQLIAELQPVVLEEKERRRREEEKRRARQQRLEQLDRQIGDCEKEIARRKAGGAELDEIALLNLEEKLARLREERAVFLSTRP